MEGADGSEMEGVEYLTKAPLHEAFATPYQANPQPGELIKNEPPAALNEIRPEFRPEGKNVEWIEGYWDWDPDRNDFVWISGLWRDLPPNMTWVPGYWSMSDAQYQRVAGFWEKTDVEEWAYLPPPPESVENGPSSPSPSEEQFYVPGNWEYENQEYAWRAGFWAPQQQDWVWVPSTYIWTPRGCIFRDGYWDYEPTYRGQLFAPVHYTQPIYRQANYQYQPRYVIDTNLALLVHLFVGPNSRNYYYGNYYGSGYRGSYTPWMNYNRRDSGWGYDPIYTYFSGSNRNEVLPWMRRNYSLFENNEQFRPGSTLREQRRVLSQLAASDADDTVQTLTRVAARLDDVVNDSEGDIKFDRVDRNRSANDDLTNQKRRELQRQRADFESSQSARLDARVDGGGNSIEASAQNSLEAGATRDRNAKGEERGRFRIGGEARQSTNDRARERADALDGDAIGKGKAESNDAVNDLNESANNAGNMLRNRSGDVRDLDRRNRDAREADNDVRRIEGDAIGKSNAASNDAVNDLNESASNAGNMLRNRSGDVRDLDRRDRGAREADNDVRRIEGDARNAINGIQAPNDRPNSNAAEQVRDRANGRSDRGSSSLRRQLEDAPRMRRPSDQRSSVLPGRPGNSPSPGDAVPRRGNNGIQNVVPQLDRGDGQGRRAPQGNGGGPGKQSNSAPKNGGVKKAAGGAGKAVGKDL